MVEHIKSNPANEVFWDMSRSADALAKRLANFAQAAGGAALNTLSPEQRQELTGLTEQAAQWMAALQGIDTAVQHMANDAYIHSAQQLGEVDLYQQFINVASTETPDHKGSVIVASLEETTTLAIGDKRLTLQGDELCIFNCIASNRMSGVTTLVLRSYFRRDPDEHEDLAMRRLNNMVPVALRKINALAPEGEVLIRRSRAGNKGYRYMLHEGLQFIDRRTRQEPVEAEELQAPEEEQPMPPLTERPSAPMSQPKSRPARQPSPPVYDSSTWYDVQDLVDLTGASYGEVQRCIDARKDQFGSRYIAPEQRVNSRAKDRGIRLLTLHLSPQLSMEIIDELQQTAPEE